MVESFVTSYGMLFTMTEGGGFGWLCLVVVEKCGWSGRWVLHRRQRPVRIVSYHGSSKEEEKERYGVAELKTLGNQLFFFASHINNLLLLLTFVSLSSPPHHVLESLLSLHSFFLPLLPKLPSSSAAAAPSTVDDQFEFIYFSWLRSKFEEFLKSLLNVLALP
ncbi:hypothetical protein JHK87_040302 [Glycine soja]|nr:hypothetical protein JHK87_040302 [Glycine soja]